MVKKLAKILSDLVSHIKAEGLTSINKIKNYHHDKRYWHYDRGEFMSRYGHECHPNDCYDSDINTLATQIMQMILYGRIIHSKYADDVRSKPKLNEAGVQDRMLTIMKRITKKYKSVQGLYTSKQKGGQMYFGFKDKAEALDLAKELKKHLTKVSYQYEKSNDRHIVLALLPGLVDHHIINKSFTTPPV